ncbi:DUF4382 domain-containing protein [Thalassomonas sp. M1454]|uniref:DUF4382 domain-containing protein n=1 Tax=Thalassomonas sp. M1454 TaxID=2594477 RepID=UPI00117F29F8|nr:DUF4382 domain-containing protein [Thalassomonas sp. M1454]TRX56754.1 DUF4382 domain-containing protein [Thalassomonas sp. M1454]
MNFKKTTLAILLSAPVLLMGCDDDDKSSNTTEFNLSVSDAPVDNASEVVVCFSEITLKKGGDETLLTLKEDTASLYECLDEDEMPIPNTLAVNLLAAQGSQSIQISEGIEIEVGEYAMRVAVPNGSGSYVMTDEDGDMVDEKILIEVPSEELKFSKFTVTQGGSANFTLEFDLRKSMTNPVGKDTYTLKPNGVRLIDNNEAGHIAGTVQEALLCEGSTFVYLYEGVELNENNLGDMYYHPETGAYQGEGVEPLASAEVIAEVQMDGSYEIGFVNTGEYTLGLTCSQDDSEMADVLEFSQIIETEVVEKQTAQADFFVQ